MLRKIRRPRAASQPRSKRPYNRIKVWRRLQPFKPARFSKLFSRVSPLETKVFLSKKSYTEKCFAQKCWSSSTSFVWHKRTNSLISSRKKCLFRTQCLSIFCEVNSVWQATVLFSASKRRKVFHPFFFRSSTLSDEQQRERKDHSDTSQCLRFRQPCTLKRRHKRARKTPDNRKYL